MLWTTDQILALAPDSSSAKSGKDLSAARKWKTLGADEACAWGSIQGSGKDPYLVSIDFTGPAFKCSCPSRKFPCKHGLGLFLILAQQPEAVTEKQPPAWTVEWMAKRGEKEEKKAAKSAEAATPASPEEEKKALAAAEKRTASRESKVTAGLEEFGIWLHDLVRNGFAGLPAKPSSFWEMPAARLVDAQAPGLARRVRDLDGITATGESWPGELLRKISLLELARESWSRMESLPAPTQCDVRSVLGFTISQEEALAQEAVRDHWLVIGQRIEEEERLRTQRTWLYGMKSRRFALALSFSASASQPLDIGFAPGTAFEGEFVFYPGAWPQRALLKARHSSQQFVLPDFPHDTACAAMSYAAEGFMANPWLERVPLALKSVTVAKRRGGTVLRDESGYCLPLEMNEEKGWTLVAVAGGRPLSVAGEWDGQKLRPLGVWVEGRHLRL